MITEPWEKQEEEVYLKGKSELDLVFRRNKRGGNQWRTK